MDFIKPISDEFKNIYFIEGERKGGYPYSNSLLLENIIIDTGISSGYIRKLKKKVEINKVLLSHWHEDHISGNRLLKDVLFYSHINDKPLIENFSDIYKKYYCILDTSIEHLFENFLDGMRIKNTKIHQILYHNQILNINDNFKIQVIHTPGHSAGHCCFLELNSKICFLGDIDFTSFGPWYAGLDSSLLDFESSLKKLEQYDFNIAITSHKGLFYGSRLIKDKLNEYKLIFNKREQEILNNLSETKAKDIEDLSNKNIIYKFYGEFKEYDLIAEKIMMKMHIEKLLNKKSIEKKNNGYVLS